MATKNFKPIMVDMYQEKQNPAISLWMDKWFGTPSASPIKNIYIRNSHFGSFASDLPEYLTVIVVPNNSVILSKIHDLIEKEA